MHNLTRTCLNNVLYTPLASLNLRVRTDILIWAQQGGGQQHNVTIGNTAQTNGWQSTHKSTKSVAQNIMQQNKCWAYQQYQKWAQEQKQVEVMMDAGEPVTRAQKGGINLPSVLLCWEC